MTPVHNDDEDMQMDEPVVVKNGKLNKNISPDRNVMNYKPAPAQ
jgi:hypothetical protein